MKSESVVAVWVGVLLLAVIFFLTGNFFDWPKWTDAFWSGWAQTLGSIGAVYAAFRVGQNQMNAAQLLKQHEEDEDRRLGLHLVYTSLFDASAAMSKLSTDPVLEAHEGLRATAVGRLIESSEALKEALRMRMSIGFRGKVLDAKRCVDQFVAYQRLFIRPLEPKDLSVLARSAAELEKMLQWFGQRVLDAEVKPRAR